MTVAATSRSQEERRSETIARLLEATIAALAECGYSNTTIKEICARADRSQGALFRHFSTRTDVIVATAEEIARRHVAQVAHAVSTTKGAMSPERAVRLLYDITRTARHAAWREVVVAARSDPALHEGLREPLQQFERAVFEMIPVVFELEEGADSQRFAVLVFSIMHMFDSEALTAAVYDNPEVEAVRIPWAIDLLAQELERSTKGDISDETT